MIHLFLLALGVLPAVGWCYAIHELTATNTSVNWWRHHFWIGLALLLVPLWPVQLIGLWLMADDAYQHLRQLDAPSYRSPLHRAWVMVIRWLLSHGWLGHGWLAQFLAASVVAILIVYSTRQHAGPLNHGIR
jgi:hypothetical protein